MGKKLVEWDVKIPASYVTQEDIEEMCKMLKDSKILEAKPSRLEKRTVIITTKA